LKKLQADMQQSARSLETSVTSEMQSAQQSLNQTAQSVTDEVKPLPVTEVTVLVPAAPVDPLPIQKV
jgi:hypothetical protein